MVSTRLGTSYFWLWSGVLIYAVGTSAESKIELHLEQRAIMLRTLPQTRDQSHVYRLVGIAFFTVLTIIAATGVIFAAAYLLWALQRILFNPLDKPENTHLPDLNRRELALLVPLIAAIIWLGVYPAPVLRQPAAPGEPLQPVRALRGAPAARRRRPGARRRGARRAS